MLSVENNPEIPCPFNLPAVKTDEKVHDQLGGTQSPSFCIRNHVFESRSKNIGLNWPFRQHCLQICLSRGINDVLPPYEPPDLVRVKCSKKRIVECSQTELKVDVSRNEFVLEESVVEVQSIVTTPDQTARNSSPNSELLSLVHVSRGVSEESSELQRKLEVSEKKCKLVVKLGSSSEITREEDLASNCSEISDPMASKVCPVCRIFVSTSNTTLNAHIDQCLSSETDGKSLVNSSSNIKVKPRKKRLMVDIYATAPRCSLEDLDRRNGRTWASDSAVLAPTSEVNTEAKRPKLCPEDTGADENEGAVYVDSNGIKLRILSKFNDALASMPKEDLKSRKETGDLKDQCNSLINKKKQFGSKYIKSKPQNKKLNFFKLSDSKIQAEAEEECEEDGYQEKEESLLQKMNSQDQSKGNVLLTIIPRVSSKRSDLQRKINNNNNIRGNLENTSSNTRTPLVETNRPRIADPSAAIQSHTVRSMDILSNTADITDNGKMSTAINSVIKSKLTSKSGNSDCGLTVKVLKSKGIILSSPKSKKEVCRNSSPKSDYIPELTTRASRSCQSSLAARKKSTLKKSNLVRKAFADEIETKHSIFKKLHKCRSMLGTGKKRGKSASDTDELSGPTKNAVSGSTTTNKAIQIQQSKNHSISETKSRRGGEEVTSMDKGKGIVSKMKIKVPTFTGDMVTNSGEEVVAGRLCRTVSASECTPASSAELGRDPSSEEHMHLPTSPNERERQCRDGTNNEVASTNDQMAGEGETRMEEHSCQLDAISIQESSACLSSQEDPGLEIPLDNSSITSNRIMSSNTDNLAIDGEPSGSAVSTASTISPSSPNEPNGSKMDGFGKLSLQQSENLKLPSMSSIKVAEGTNTERRNQEIEAIVSAKELVQLSDAQVCCCSRRDYLDREPQFSTMHISSGKQMVSNLQIKPITPPFSHCSSFRADMESPTASISTMASSDSAIKVPTIHDLSSPSPTQSTSKPVLRLMGKNLTVECKEESTQLPSPMSDTTPSSQGFSNHHPFHYQHQQHQQHFMGVPPLIFSQAPSMANQQIPLHSYGMLRELNVIDDTVPRANTSSAAIPASNLFQHRPFSYFQPHSQLIPLEFHNGFQPSFDNSRVAPRGSAAGDSVPLPPGTLRLPPPFISHLHPSFFYPAMR
ncbi:hypothetical protein J5N97_026385 [Dioscorea zingiberensis]|uniref:UBZ4-type domain-containing protein n=1 Tax=Dioscorea zingiberensis TaxID=325984 RepID=A0A9D5C3F8_9LILI|nr:hypothetical protein J5N97_026385 [Dioscorea zingiberensis]